tara:strand:- start:165 stop:347 length:183 start_codon:yes stop_codon:yes gene_type:complete
MNKIIILVLLLTGCGTVDRSINQVLTETKTKKQSNIKCPKETIKVCIGFPKECGCYKRRV